MAAQLENTDITKDTATSSAPQKAKKPKKKPQKTDIHHEGDILCVTCNKSFTVQAKYRRHVRITHEREQYVYTCSHCCKTLKRKDAIMRHISLVHGPGSEAMAIPQKKEFPLIESINPVQSSIPQGSRTFEAVPWTRKRTQPSLTAPIKKSTTNPPATVDTPSPKIQKLSTPPIANDGVSDMPTLEDLLTVTGTENKPVNITDSENSEIELSLYANLHQSPSNEALIKDLTVSDTSSEEEEMEEYTTIPVKPLQVIKEIQPTKVISTKEELTQVILPQNIKITVPVQNVSHSKYELVPIDLTTTTTKPTSVVQPLSIPMEKNIAPNKMNNFTIPKLSSKPIGKLLVEGRNQSSQTDDAMMWNYMFKKFMEGKNPNSTLTWTPPIQYPPKPRATQPEPREHTQSTSHSHTRDDNREYIQHDRQTHREHYQAAPQHATQYQHHDRHWDQQDQGQWNTQDYYYPRRDSIHKRLY